MASDWKWLPDHLLDSTWKKLESPIDYLRFSTICSHWHTIAKYNENKPTNMLRSNQVPMLLLPNIEEEHTLRVYNVLDNEFLESQLSVAYSKRFCGSSEGWLVTVDENFGVTLYKPFSMVKESNGRERNSIIRLPCLFPDANYVDVHDYHVFKAKITADPIDNPNDCTVVVIYSDLCKLAYVKLSSKDMTWTRVDTHRWRTFEDVLHYSDRFYAVTCNGQLISFSVKESSDLDVKLIVGKPGGEEDDDDDEDDNNSDEDSEEEETHDDYDDDDDSDNDEDSEEVEENDDQDDNDDNDNDQDNNENNNEDDDDGANQGGTTKRYLVETSERELWQIVRHFYWNRKNRESRVTDKFTIYKLDFSGPKWVEMENLGDISLFLGDNSSISVTSSKFSGCRPNCIYFTHDYDTVYYASDCRLHDLGVYDVGSGETELHYSVESLIAKISEQPPIWVVPTVEY